MEYVYNGKQIVLVEVTKGDNSNLVILGNGFSLGDPGLSIPKEKDFKFCGTSLAMFFKKDCTGLEAAQEELADFINKEYDKYKKVVLYGHSKCGVMFYNILPLIQKPVTAISVSAPFKGSFWADGNMVKERLWCNRDFIAKLFKGWQYGLYKMIFSNHAVDQDIIAGSEYLTKERNIPDFHTTVNVVSVCHGLLNVIFNKKLWNKQAVLAMLLSPLNILAKYEKGDGIVSRCSQWLGEIENENQHLVLASHATSFVYGREILKSYLV